MSEITSEQFLRFPGRVRYRIYSHLWEVRIQGAKTSHNPPFMQVGTDYVCNTDNLELNDAITNELQDYKRRFLLDSHLPEFWYIIVRQGDVPFPFMIQYINDLLHAQPGQDVPLPPNGMMSPQQIELMRITSTDLLPKMKEVNKVYIRFPLVMHHPIPISPAQMDQYFPVKRILDKFSTGGAKQDVTAVAVSFCLEAAPIDEPVNNHHLSVHQDCCGYRAIGDPLGFDPIWATEVLYTGNGVFEVERHPDVDLMDESEG